MGNAARALVFPALTSSGASVYKSHCDHYLIFSTFLNLGVGLLVHLKFRAWMCTAAWNFTLLGLVIGGKSAIKFCLVWVLNLQSVACTQELQCGTLAAETPRPFERFPDWRPVSFQTSRFIRLVEVK
jgi:hypothetical protein